MKHRIPRWLAISAAAAAATLGASVFAMADTPPPVDNSAAPYAVEDFTYPSIATPQGIKLHRGDGHVTLADCASATQIQVWTRASTNADGKFCFAVTGATGYLSLELPEVYAVQTTDRVVRASLTADGATQVLEVPKGDFKGVGEGTNSTPTTNVELHILS